MKVSGPLVVAEHMSGTKMYEVLSATTIYIPPIWNAVYLI